MTMQPRPGKQQRRTHFETKKARPFWLGAAICIALGVSLCGYLLLNKEEIPALTQKAVSEANAEESSMVTQNQLSWDDAVALAKDNLARSKASTYAEIVQEFGLTSHPVRCYCNKTGIAANHLRDWDYRDIAIWSIAGLLRAKPDTNRGDAMREGIDECLRRQ